MNGKKLIDMATGPDWLFYVVAALLAILSILLLAGKGSWLIAGYNTSSEKEKSRYKEKTLCRTVGGGLAAETVMLLAMELLEDMLPASFIYLFTALRLANCVIMAILGNTICKKK